ncbi:MAG TPA: hypothetical protein VKH65_06460, partial [Myxococcales bacterium]|nr:hypothetical protein [Myxococcales bacterium]
MRSAMLSQLAAAGAAVLAAAAVTLLAGAALHAVAVLRAFRRTALAALADASGRVVPAHWRSVIAEALRRAGRPGELSPDELVALVLLCAAAFLGAGAVGCFSLGLGAVA